MRKYLLVLIATCAIVTPAVANEPWWCCDMCFNVSGGVEALYLKPCTSTFVYGQTRKTVDGINTDKSVGITPNYDWGFRIFGTISDECDLNGVTLSWTYLKASTSATNKRTADNNLVIFDEGSQGAYASAGLIKAKDRYRYHNVHLRGTHIFSQACDNSFYVYGGVRYVYIRNDRKADNPTEVGDIIPVVSNNTQSQFSGAGIEVGLGGEVSLGCGFSLVMRGGGAGLVGERKLHLRNKSKFSVQSIFITNIEFSDSRTICLPGLDARVGFKYGYDCWCVNFDLEIGYQAEYYFNILAQANTDEPVQQLSIDNVGFAGPYIGLTLSY